MITESAGGSRATGRGRSPVCGPDQMGDDDAFLRAIADAPADDAPRLVYADWLDEHGQSDQAEYLRLTCRKPSDVVVKRLRELAPTLDPKWATRVNRDF